MRTTIDLDPDVDARLRQLARERGVPFRQVVNEALRRGLHPSLQGDREPYRLPVRRLGIRPDIDIDKALSLAADLEDEATLHKLELRK